MKRVLVTETMHACAFDILGARDDIEIINLKGDIRPETLIAHMPGVHAIAVRSAHLTADVLSHANDLEIVSRHGVGCDLIDVDYLSGRGIPVAIAAGANSLSVAEHTMALMLALARELPAQDKMAKGGNWKNRNEFQLRDLRGATILIVGFGRIGRLVAPLCTAFGMNVIAADIAPDYALAGEMGIRLITDFHDALAEADYVTLHVPLDDKTRHLVGTAEFTAMKDGVIVLNCARGGIVDDDAMLAALDAGKVFAAGIDVLDREPPEPDHPVLKRDDVIVTPHNGAASISSSIAMARMAAENILDCFDGRLKDDMIFNLDGLR
ncbi:hydroxyacid dehydrogenase [Thalassospiraceae bacterium LMO-JJ14]|nr:hydroxyacid dehydrogenase [Thalassospiraceae bacterium LMO-JJ14]